MDTQVTALAALIASVLVSNVHEVAAQTQPATQHSNAAGDNTAGANLPSQHQPAGDNDSDDRREQPGRDRQENERRRKAESRYQGQIADITEAALVTPIHVSNVVAFPETTAF
jgi:hypothetical protein